MVLTVVGDDEVNQPVKNGVTIVSTSRIKIGILFRSTVKNETDYHSSRIVFGVAMAFIPLIGYLLIKGVGTELKGSIKVVVSIRDIMVQETFIPLIMVGVPIVKVVVDLQKLLGRPERSD